MIYIIFILIKSFSELSSPVDGGGVIIEEATPIRIEMLDKGDQSEELFFGIQTIYEVQSNICDIIYSFLRSILLLTKLKTKFMSRCLSVKLYTRGKVIL